MDQNPKMDQNPIMDEIQQMEEDTKIGPKYKNYEWNFVDKKPVFVKKSNHESLLHLFCVKKWSLKLVET